ncbi:MAG: hypothetical protein CVV42_12715 [Candidatus Riflebacteria bacterium HGW-Riflebacteria-2]|jgi:HEAT repeat protein|nr:MAG: hypothetical protein CVV42_12715 [Candidatus Riflebacteria bacterium HGW-Riflebacteria-2]
MDSLVEAFLKSPHEEDRKKAVGALARAADREAVIALQQLAEIDESLEIRFYARKALAMVKSMRRTRSDDPLLKLIPERLDEETFQSFSDDEKCQLLKALIGQNRSDTLSCLLSLLKIEQNPHVVATLVIAIGTFGTVAECRFLIPCLTHRDARVRANTIEALELIGNLKLFAYIFPLLEDPDNRVRANAARSLKSIEPFTSFRLLQAMISSGKVAFQASAIFVLRCFESDASAALVAPFLASPHEDLRVRSEQTLRLLADKGVARAVELIENMAAPVEQVERVELSPEEILAELTGHPDPVQEMFYRLKQAFIISDPRQRLEEIEKESLQLGEKSVEPLMEFLEQESDPMVVGKIYILLGRLYDARAVPCLLAGLSSSDNRCRANAVEAIGMLGDPESLAYLIPFLDDPHNRVRGNAILALRAADGVDIKAAIMSLVEHSEEFYQRTAVYVLAELQRPEYFPILQRMTRAAFPVVRKNAHTAINALIKAGFNVSSGNADEHTSPAAEPEFADQIIGMIGGPSGSRIRPSAISKHHKSPEPFRKEASDWSVAKTAGVVTALLICLAGVIFVGNLYLRFSAEKAAKAAAVDAALSRARPAAEQGRVVAAKIPAAVDDAEKVLAAAARDSAQAVAAQKKLARMQEAVNAAKTLIQSFSEVVVGFEKTHKIVGDHCQKLIGRLNEVKQAPSGQIHPYTGHFDPEDIKTELSALATLRDELNRASSFVAKLPASITRTRSDMPAQGNIESEQSRFTKLAEVLAVFDRPVAALVSLEKDILREVEAIESAENELVRANPRHAMLAELSALKGSLYDGRDRLLKTHETMLAKKQDTEKLIADGDVSQLLADTEQLSPELDVAAKSAEMLLEIPGMLQQSLGGLVKTMVMLHQKAFAERVKVGIEADFSTNWDAVVKKENSKLAELYTAAHPTGRITAEGVSAFANVDLAEISDELQAVSALIGKANTFLGNAGR